MTEPEWLTDSDPWAMLGVLRACATDRKLRLLGCAARNRWWPCLSDARSRAALEVSERFADGLATEDELATASREAMDAFVAAVGLYGTGDERCRAAEWVHFAVHAGRTHSKYAGTNTDDTRTACARIRDIFGNPFRSALFCSEWRTDTAVTLARQMYESRDFSTLPILADAIQDAGCDNENILSHCRGDRPHVRGCWVVDLVLGKE